MERLIRIGRWNDWAMEHRYAWPQQFVVDWNIPYLDAITNYLKSGSVCATYKSDSWCRICKKILGNHDLTDGVFVWREGLDHYVTEHNVLLPPQFLAHMDRHRWSPYTIDDAEEKYMGVGECRDLWIDWCRFAANPTLEPLTRTISEYEPLPNDFIVCPRVMNALFFIIESCDIPVFMVQVDRMDRLEGFSDIMYKNGEKSYIWNARLLDDGQKGFISIAGGTRKDFCGEGGLGFAAILATCEGKPGIVVSAHECFGDNINDLGRFVCTKTVDEKDFRDFGDFGKVPNIHHQMKNELCEV